MARYRIYNASTNEDLTISKVEASVIRTTKLEMNQKADAIYIANALNVTAFPEKPTWKIEEVQD